MGLVILSVPLAQIPANTLRKLPEETFWCKWLGPSTGVIRAYLSQKMQRLKLCECLLIFQSCGASSLTIANLASSFLVDGNAYFFTAVDITRRMEYLNDTRTVVVGIGYPNTKAVYDFRRGPDLTPASADGEYEMPLDKHGNPRTDIRFGEAAEHLDFIRKDVMDYVYGTLLPLPELKNGRKALFGHSYGGIFALYALFTAPTLFDAFIAASPIVWWNKHFLAKDLEPAFCARQESISSPPSLFLTWGYGRQDLTKRPDESQEAFQIRLIKAEDEQMKDEVLAMASRLRKCPKLRSVVTHEFQNEDHGSVSVTSLQMAIMNLLQQEI
jgi:predicted alpha/beta superfamily hydrolase